MEGNEEVMELRARFLHREVLIVDGTEEDGERGYVVGVTAHSANPITVLFYTVGPVRHCNYYAPADLQLTGEEWAEGKQRSQEVRCHRSRFTGLYYICTGRGPSDTGYGTPGGAWSAYLAAIGRKEESNGEENHGEAASVMASSA